MTERQLTQRFLKQLKVEYPLYYWYKIGDTFGGHKKPCDMVSCIQGKFVGIEFKKGPGKLTEYQLESLSNIIDSGGKYIVGYFSEDGKELHFDNITLHYSKGRYKGLSKWIKSIEII